MTYDIYLVTNKHTDPKVVKAKPQCSRMLAPFLLNRTSADNSKAS